MEYIKTIAEVKEFIRKNKYYMEPSNKNFFYFISIFTGLFSVSLIQTLYVFLTQGWEIPLKLSLSKNIILLTIITGTVLWLKKHITKDKIYRKKYNEAAEVLKWYQLYKNYRDGISKRKSELTVFIRKVKMIKDTYRNTYIVEIAGTTSDLEHKVLRFYCYDESMKNYLVTNMTVDILIRDEIAYEIKIKK
jgi:hypothetical protein